MAVAAKMETLRAPMSSPAHAAEVLRHHAGKRRDKIKIESCDNPYKESPAIPCRWLNKETGCSYDGEGVVYEPDLGLVVCPLRRGVIELISRNGSVKV